MTRPATPAVEGVVDRSDVRVRDRGRLGAVVSCSSPGATHHAACDCRESSWAARLAAAEAEVERLKDALMTVAHLCGSDSDYYIREAKAIARAALAEVKP